MAGGHPGQCRGGRGHNRAGHWCAEGFVAIGMLGIAIGTVALAIAVALLQVMRPQAGFPRFEAPE